MPLGPVGFSIQGNDGGHVGGQAQGHDLERRKRQVHVLPRQYAAEYKKRRNQQGDLGARPQS